MNGAPEHIRISAEAALPETLSEQDDLVFARLIFLIGEHAAQNRLKAQHRKQSRGRFAALQTLGAIDAREIEIVGVDGGDFREQLSLFAIVDVIGDRGGGRIQADGFVLVLDDDDALRMREGERAQQSGIDHAEDGSVGADAECQRKHGGEGEAGAAAQNPRGVGYVFEQSRHLCTSWVPGGDVQSTGRAGVLQRRAAGWVWVSGFGMFRLLWGRLPTVANLRADCESAQLAPIPYRRAGYHRCPTQAN